jgi:hypothetical protein
MHLRHYPIDTTKLCVSQAATRTKAWDFLHQWPEDDLECGHKHNVLHLGRQAGEVSVRLERGGEGRGGGGGGGSSSSRSRHITSVTASGHMQA